jgi:HEAT repeat protein
MKKKRLNFLYLLKESTTGWRFRLNSPAGDKYLNRYLDALISDYRFTRDFSTCERGKVMEFEESYVPLNLKEIYRDPGASPPQQRMGIEAALQKYNYLLILGTAGAGKTTLLHYLALEFCREKIQAREQNRQTGLPIPIPIPITLREFSGSGLDLREYIDRVFKKYQCPKTKKWLASRLKQGQCILLADGLDELTDPTDQEKATLEIRGFIKTCPGCKVVVTSRISGYREGLTGFMRLEVLDLDYYQANTLAGQWYGPSRRGKAEALLKMLRENGELEALAKNPLLLSVLAALCDGDNDIPPKPAEVYQRLADVLLADWDAAKNIKHRFSPDKKRFILRKLAFRNHYRSRRTMTEREILAEIARHSTRLNLEEEQFRPFFAEVWQRTDILKKRFTDTYDFLYLSFQEYFTALELNEREDGIATIIPHLFETWWQAPIRFFCGVTPRVDSLVKRIHQTPSDLFYNNLLLSGRCIADALEIDPLLKEEIVQELWWIYTSGEFALLQEKTLAVLSRVKPRRIMDQLVNQLTDKEPAARRFAAETLGQIGSPQVLPALLMVLAKDKESKVRSEAALALGRIGSTESIRILIQVLRGDLDSEVRKSAALALGLIGSSECLPELFNVLTWDKDNQARMGAAEAVGKIKALETIPQLIRAFANEEETSVRWRLLLSLGKLGGREARDLLIKVLISDNAPEVRESAAEGLGLIGGAECIPPLRQALNSDKEADVRGSAAYALGLLKCSEALPELIKVLISDDNSEVRGRAAYALGRLGNLEAVPYLSVVFGIHQASIVRGNATFALGQLGGVDALSFLTQTLLADQDPYVRYRAAEALGHVGNAMTIPSLKEALKDDGHYYGWKVKDKAFEALETISKRLQVKIFKE